MPDNIKILSLGGLDEPGRDCYVIEINDDIFVVEAGLALPDKSIPGVDYILPNFEYLIQILNYYFLKLWDKESVNFPPLSHSFVPE